MNELLGNIVLGDYVLGGGEGSGSSAPPISVSGFDSVAFTDGAAGWNLHGKAADTLEWADDTVFSATGNYVLDFLGLSDALSLSATLNISVADALTLLDRAGTVIPVAAADTLSWADAGTGSKVQPGVSPDIFTLTDAVGRTVTSRAQAQDAYEPADTLFRNVRRRVSASDTFSPADSVAVLKVRAAKDAVALTDSAAIQFVRAGRDYLDLGSVASHTITRTRSATSTLPLPDAVAASFLLFKTVGDAVTLTDAAAALVSKPVLDALTLTDSSAAVSSKPVSDGVQFDDFLGYTRTLNDRAADTVDFQDAQVTVLSAGRSVADALALTDAGTGRRQRFGTATDALTLTDQARRDIYRVAVDDLTNLTDSASARTVRGPRLTDALALNDSVNPVVIRARGRADWFPIVDGATVVLDPVDQNVLVPGDGLHYGYVPGPSDRPALPDYLLPLTPYENVFFEGVDPYLALFYQAGARPVRPINGQVPITIPAAVPEPGVIVAPIPQVQQGVVVVRRRVLIVGASSLVVLPPPEFGDSEAPETKVDLRRSMAGNTRTFVQTSPRRRLKWAFQVPKAKSVEFRKFLDREAGSVLRITDWRGDVWRGNLVSDSLVFAEVRRGDPCGNWVQVEVEFSAVKTT